MEMSINIVINSKNVTNIGYVLVTYINLYHILH